MKTPQRDLPTFERLVRERKRPEAVEAAIQILGALDQRRGQLHQAELQGFDLAQPAENVAQAFATRFTAALGELLADPQVELTRLECERLLIHHRWIDMLFALSGFGSSEHLLPAWSGHGLEPGTDPKRVRLHALLCMFSANARPRLDFERCWRIDGAMTALALLHYVSSKHVFDVRSHELRERILEWLPSRLDQVKLGPLTVQRASAMYMHCSYADTPRKHELKRALMAQMRRACLAAGCVEAHAAPQGASARRPRVAVIAENLRPNHAVFRTHSLAIRSLRERFEVIGTVFPDPESPVIADLFDQCLTFPLDEFMSSVKACSQAIVERAPDLVLFVGVGMVPQVVALASLRLAPVQCASFGHTATTMSDTIDYFVLPQDFVAAPHTFSEQVVALPREAMPTVPPPLPALPAARRDGKVRVAIPGSVMKLNPGLFRALGKIARTARTPHEFHFFPGGAVGLPHLLLTRQVKSLLPTATVYPEVAHDTYMQALSQCDFFLCPFPYGNMNSIVDAFLLGLPGVCLDGEESHAHADAAYFARVGLPAELVAQSRQDYVSAAVKLIDDEGWRSHCRAIVKRADLDAAFFVGDTRSFALAIERLLIDAGQ